MKVFIEKPIRLKKRLTQQQKNALKHSSLLLTRSGKYLDSTRYFSSDFNDLDAINSFIELIRSLAKYEIVANFKQKILYLYELV